MAFGSSHPTTYDVSFRVYLAKLRADIAEAGGIYEGGINKMSRSSLALALAQDKLDVALAKTGANSRATARATLELKNTEERLYLAAHKTSGALQAEERSLGRLARGALSGSGIMHGFGRSLAFASTAFLGGTGFVYAVRASIKAATDHEAAQVQLAAALKASGISYAQYKTRIDDALRSTRLLTGFTEENTTRAFTLLVRTTGSVEGGLRALGVASNIALGANKPLEETALKVARAFNGQTRGLIALGIHLDKGVKGWQAIDIAQAKYAGSAVAASKTAAVAQARLTQAIHETEITIGTALLPTVSRLATQFANWAGKSKNQERIQRDVNQAVRDGVIVAHDLGVGIHYIGAVIGPVNRALGGFKHTLELVALEVGALKLAGLAGGFRGVAAAEGAAAAQGTVLAGSLARLKAFGTISVLVAVDYELARGAQKLGSFLDRRFPGLFGSDSRTISRADLVNGARSGKYSRGQLEAFRALGAKSADVDAAIAALDSASRGGGFHGHRAPPDRSTGGGGTTSAADSANLDARSRIDLNLARTAGSTGSDRLSALGAQVSFDDKYIRIQERLLRTDVKNKKEHAAILQRLYADRASAQSEIDSINQQAAQKAQGQRDKAARQRAAEARKAASQARKSGEETARELAYAFREQQKAYDKANREWAKEQKAADRAAKKAAGKTGTTSDFNKLAFSFLQNLHGFDSTVGSNIRQPATSSSPTTVNVHQYFHEPTKDRLREAIYARNAIRSLGQFA